MKYNLYTKLFGFVFFILASFLVVSFVKAVPAYADALNCASAVFYQDAQGNVYCITNADSSKDNAVGSDFQPSDFGYRSSATLIPSSSSESGSTGQIVGYKYKQSAFGSDIVETPLFQYTQNRACLDADIYASPGFTFCKDIIASVVSNSNIPRLSVPNTNTALACVFENVEITGQKFGIVICNAAVDSICSNDGYLRAGFTNALGTINLYFWCDQLTGNGNNGDSVDPSTLKSSPPTLSNVINSVGQCYTSPDGYNLNDGTQLMFNLNNPNVIQTHFSGYTEQLTPISKNVVNGYCIMSTIGESSALPKNTINCQIATYYSTHQTECNCISYYNPYSKTRLANGNTYTALGCISSNFGDVINTFLSIAIGIAGAIALLMMIIGGYEIMTNPAGPDEIKEGQQYIVNAILGLLLIIFTVVVLKIIGVDILGINELAKLLGT